MDKQQKVKKKNIRCILIHNGTPIMACGIPAMAAFLSSHGYECEVRNLFSESKSGISQSISDITRDFDIAGISLHWFYQAPAAMKIASGIKKTNPEIFVVTGGMTSSFFAKEILQFSMDIDGVIKGDGEIPLLKLCEEISRGKKRNLKNVPNLIFRNSKGIIESSTAEPYVGTREIIDSLDFADYSVVKNFHLYMRTSSWREITDGSPACPFDISSTFYLCGGRGCSVQCLYCGGGIEAQKIHSFRNYGFIFRSPEKLAADVEKAIAFGYRTFHACFDPQPYGQHWIEFMNLLKERNIKTNFIFECFSLPSEKFIKTARECMAGVLLVISPDTAIEEFRKKCKGFFYTNRQIEESLNLIKNHDINAQVFFGYFHPEETQETVEKTLNYIKTLEEKFGKFASFHYYPYSTDPASPVQLYPEKFKITCNIQKFEDYLKELGNQEKITGNLLRHYPSGKEKSFWNRMTLKIEIERGLARIYPDLYKKLIMTQKSEKDKMLSMVVEEILNYSDISRIERLEAISIAAQLINEKLSHFSCI